VICISESTKNDLCNYSSKIDPAKVFVTHLAAEPSMFYQCKDFNKINSVRNKYKIPEGSYMLGLSTLEPRKNLDHIIRCFAQVIQETKIQDLSLVLVGNPGWNYGKILEEISNHKLLANRVIVTGRVADEDLAALYSGAIVFIYPSFCEGFGLPPLEAMQCGIPVITSNTSSLPEVVGDAGIMLDPTNTDGLCQSMLEIYNKPSLREAMSLKSLEQAKKFSWDKCTKETIAAYKTALSLNR
jgi:glycosyltransferase involved in cell wall biosynthesis